MQRIPTVSTLHIGDMHKRRLLQWARVVALEVKRSVQPLLSRTDRRAMILTGTSQPLERDLNPNRASDLIEEELRRMIITMELPPGVTVSQPYLAERLKCGRTPLREALQRLAQEYMVTAVPGGGFSVAGLSVVDYMDILEALRGFEPFIVRLAAARISADDLARLDEILSQAEEANAQGDLSTVARCDFDFHRTIAQASNNRHLSDTCTRLQQILTRFGYVFWQRAGSAATSLAEHRQVLAALRAQDVAEAERLAVAHTEHAGQRIGPVL
jgi:GntR family transcriptional regulator, rspAB operon transcriptional repressor